MQQSNASTSNHATRHTHSQDTTATHPSGKHVNYERLACYEHCPGTFGYTFVVYWTGSQISGRICEFSFVAIVFRIYYVTCYYAMHLESSLTYYITPHSCFKFLFYRCFYTLPCVTTTVLWYCLIICSCLLAILRNHENTVVILLIKENEFVYFWNTLHLGRHSLSYIDMSYEYYHIYFCSVYALTPCSCVHFYIYVHFSCRLLWRFDNGPLWAETWRSFNVI